MLVGVLSPLVTHILWHLPLSQRLLEEMKLRLRCWKYSFWHLQPLHLQSLIRLSPLRPSSFTCHLHKPTGEVDVAALCRGCSFLCLPELLSSSPWAWPGHSSALTLWLEAVAHPRQNQSLQEAEELYRSLPFPHPSLAGTSLLTGIQNLSFLGCLALPQDCLCLWWSPVFLVPHSHKQLWPGGPMLVFPSPNSPSSWHVRKSLIFQAVQWISIMAFSEISPLSPVSEEHQPRGEDVMLPLCTTFTDVLFATSSGLENFYFITADNTGALIAVFPLLAGLWKWKGDKWQTLSSLL